MVREKAGGVVWFTPVTKWTMSNHAMHPADPYRHSAGGLVGGKANTRDGGPSASAAN